MTMSFNAIPNGLDSWGYESNSGEHNKNGRVHGGAPVGLSRARRVAPM